MDKIKNALEKKLYEECKEVIELTADERLEELVDMLEVINAIATVDKKNEKRGAFEEKIFLKRLLKQNKN